MRYALRKTDQLTGARKVLTAWRPAPGIFSKANEARPGPPTRESVPHFLSARPGHISRQKWMPGPGHVSAAPKHLQNTPNSIFINDNSFSRGSKPLVREDYRFLVRETLD